MPLPKILAKYLDGLDASADGRGFNAEHESARQYVESAVNLATIRRDALARIADFPANRNSDPDLMARAIEFMQAIAQAALDAEQGTAKRTRYWRGNRGRI